MLCFEFTRPIYDRRSSQVDKKFQFPPRKSLSNALVLQLIFFRSLTFHRILIHFQMWRRLLLARESKFRRVNRVFTVTPVYTNIKIKQGKIIFKKSTCIETFFYLDSPSTPHTIEISQQFVKTTFTSNTEPVANFELAETELQEKKWKMVRRNLRNEANNFV